MSQTKTNPRTTDSRALSATRVYAAPRSLLFELWTDPLHFAQWWGPHGFTTPLCEMDARPGGAMLVHMSAPDGTVHKMTGSYREVSPPERLVFVSAVPDENGIPIFEVLNTVTFAERAGMTSMHLSVRVIHRTPAADPYLAGMDDGWKQTLERFESYIGEVVQRQARS
ncbi:MAG TPA: SRPBCC domain-containing protein [Planctomycetota bacterium]|nr:SRPBCC domain-containing protein [Planctomycetota bacterium]